MFGLKVRDEFCSRSYETIPSGPQLWQKQTNGQNEQGDGFWVNTQNAESAESSFFISHKKYHF